jgi:predicted  nucleic acid-binding Zn-ribbon protein
MVAKILVLCALLALSVRPVNIPYDLEYSTPVHKGSPNPDISALLELSKESANIDQNKDLSIYDMSLKTPHFNQHSPIKGTCSAKIKQARERISALEIHMSDVQTKAEFYENQANSVKSENNQLRAKITQLLEKLNQTSNCESLNAKINELQSHNQRLIADNKKLFDDNKALNESSNKLRVDLANTNGENKTLRTKTDELKSDYATLNEKFKKLQSDYDRLVKDSSEISNLRKELETLLRQKNELSSKLTDLNVKLNQLIGAGNKLSDENVKLFNDNKLLSSKNKKLTEDFKKSTEDWRIEAEELRQIVASLKARLELAESAQQNNDKFKDQVKEFRNIIGLLEKRIQVLETEKSMLNAKIDGCKGEVESLNTEILKKAMELNNCRRKQNSDNSFNGFLTTATASTNVSTGSQFNNDFSHFGSSVAPTLTFDAISARLQPQPLHNDQSPRIFTGKTTSSDFD